MWMVYLAKMKYFCIGGELFFSAQAGDYVCAVKAAIAGDTGCFFAVSYTHLITVYKF